MRLKTRKSNKQGLTPIFPLILIFVMLSTLLLVTCSLTDGKKKLTNKSVSVLKDGVGIVNVASVGVTETVENTENIQTKLNELVADIITKNEPGRKVVFVNLNYGSNSSYDDFVSIQDDLLYYLSLTEENLRRLNIDVESKRFEKNIAFLLIDGKRSKEIYSVLDSEHIYNVVFKFFDIK